MTFTCNYTLSPTELHIGMSVLLSENKVFYSISIVAISAAVCFGILLLVYSSVKQFDCDNIENPVYLNYTKSALVTDKYDTVCIKEKYKEVITGVPDIVYDGLTRIVPKKVGERRIISVEGKNYTIITLALEPPIFEIPNYLTDVECANLINLALLSGLFPSTVIGGETEITDNNGEVIQRVAKPTNTVDLKRITRVSEQAWLYHTKHVQGNKILIRLKNRLISATGLPRKIIFDSEPLQVVRYRPGGHYHAHTDSSEYDATTASLISNKQFDHLPCCHQKSCPLGRERQCCRLCRYMTVMYYLNNVKEGGNTAFIKAKSRPDEPDVQGYSLNLSYNCSDAKLLLVPRKGSAIIWYNHHINPDTGWLGDPDPMTTHGGCDVIRGEKWIANSWINVPFYNSRYKDTVF